MLGALRGWGGKVAGWWGGLGGMSRSAIAGAGFGAMAGGYGANPLNILTPWDIDVGGAFGGAILGAGGGAAWGKWGAGRNLLGKGIGQISNSPYWWTAAGRSGGQMFRGGPMAARAFDVIRTAGQWSNRHGDKMLLGLGASSAGLIGGSILSSNNSY